MVSKNQEKLINSLSMKKYRDKTGLFLAEGPKLFSDLTESGLKPHLIIADKSWQPPHEYSFDTEHIIVNENELKKLSLQKTPQNIIAIFHQPQRFYQNNFSDSILLGLDGIQDPGNFGTILRIADWFGFNDIVCSIDTVDLYNPKVVQASMGSIARVNVQYVNFEEFCANYIASGNMIYGTFLNGENIYSTTIQNGLIVFGNEGNGIRPEIENKISKRITIPAFSTNKLTSESLNVSIAAAIVCSEFKRKSII